MMRGSIEKRKPLQIRIPALRDKTQVPKNTVTLNFRPDRTTFGRFGNRTSLFRTFYNTLDSPKTHRYQPTRTRKTGRETAFTERDSIIGTPFSTQETKEHQIIIPVMSSLDRERYRYLLNALSGISKTKKLPEYHSPAKLPKQKQFFKDMLSPSSHSPEGIIGSPRVVNMSADFKLSSRENSRLDFDNAFQKMFKNKKLLQKGRYHSFRESSAHHFELCMLGDEELTVKPAAIRNRKEKKLSVV